MTDYSKLLQPDKGQPAHDLHLVAENSLENWLKDRTDTERSAALAQGFDGKNADIAILPGEQADDWSVLVNVSDAGKLSTWSLAAAAQKLPAGTYRLDEGSPGIAVFGWLMAHYAFDRYKKDENAGKNRVLLTETPARIDEVVAQAGATAMVRDLVNIPAEDMGPADIQQVAETLAAESVAAMNVIMGDELKEGYPMVAAVGRAATRERAPRLIEIEWGNPGHPPIAIVGKGVCFDSGGLNIKTGSGMRWMKKDMGGAAHALGLAKLIMTQHLPVRLHLLIPAVENAIAGNATRPGDILSSRKGLSVEIGNTDAEGRLILGDALARACENNPELVIDFATLTGAARIALGPDLPALFTDNEDLASDLTLAGAATGDPVWRLPIWEGYDEMLKSSIADINNSAPNSMAGATTAALFLKKFVDPGVPWVHFDTFAWQPSAKPGRPVGGEALGLRASWAVLKARYAT